MSALQVRQVSKGHAEYPALLREIAAPPASLYVAGQRITQGPCVAVVGARKATPYGCDVAYQLALDLAAAGVIVVSGLAHGIDTRAHEGALDAGGKTIAVLGSGVDVCYPLRNLSVYRQILATGSILSEYPPGTKPLAFHFPARNRIIAGSSLGVVVVEGRRDGGAMITARLAMESGREVFAVPGAIHSDNSCGPHSLIQDGARLVVSADDVLEELGFLKLRAPSRSVEPLEGDEARVLEVVGAHPVLLDQIAAGTGLPPSAAVSVLSRLELKGLVRAYPGGRFALSVAAGRGR